MVDPQVLLGEIDYLSSRGIDVGPEKLKISEKAHVIMTYHKAIDHGREKMKGDKKIGTTGRGIGPCYEDKATRRGVRFVDLINKADFKDRVDAVLGEKNFYLKAFLGGDPVEEDEMMRHYTEMGARLAPYVTDVSVQLHEGIREGKQILQALAIYG